MHQKATGSRHRPPTAAQRVAKLLDETSGKALVVKADPALARAVTEVDAIRRSRDRMVRRKRLLVDARQRLLGHMPPRWRAARDRRRWRHGLGAVEFRDETALIDQFAMMDRFVAPNGDVIAEAVEVNSEPNKDERWWSFVMRGEAVLARRFIAPQERFVRELLSRQKRFLDRTQTRLHKKRVRSPAVGTTLTVLLFVPLLLFKLLLKLQGLLFLNVVKGQKAITGGAVALPLNVKTGFLATKEELRTEESRRKFRLSFLNERLWTADRRNALLFVLVIAAGLVYILSEIVFQLAVPQLLAAKRAGDVVVLYAMATRLFLPTPFEPILIGGADVLGVGWAVFFAAAGATLGCYLLFILGSQANQLLHVIAKKRPRLGRLLLWMEDRGRKHAYWILGLLLAIPFSPDSLAILGTLIRLRLSGFLVTIFIATLIRSTIFLTLIM
jgi:uncharacterized membrane protein YdjX (TVP38/TMEM64 family)